MIKDYKCLAPLVLACAISCQPKVLVFTAEPREATTTDSIHLSWKTRGKASMVVYQKPIYRQPDTLQALEFFLTATKWGKTSAQEPRQITIRPAVTRDALGLNLTKQEGDSLVYSTTKDTSYARFELLSLTAASGRGVTVAHLGRQCSGPGPALACMQGLPYTGYWELRTKITAGEQQDRHTIPNSYTLTATITPKK